MNKLRELHDERKKKLLNIVDEEIFEIIDPKTEITKHYDDDKHIKWLYEGTNTIKQELISKNLSQQI